jgi:hypothetical protein
LLETIRQYAQDRLEESEHAGAVRQQHAEYFISVAEAAGPGLRGGDQIATANRLARDTDNFRAALDWAIEAGSPDHALRMLAPLVMTSLSIGWSAMAWAAAACEIPGADAHPCFPHVCAMAALDAALGAETERAEALVARAEAAERALGVTEPWLFAARGTVAMFRGDFAGSQAQGEAWVAWARPTGDPYHVAHALGLLGSALRPESPRAVPVLEEAIDIARRAGISSILTIGLMVLGFVLPPDESDRALALLAEAAELATALGDRFGAANVRSMSIKVAIDAGDWSNALPTSVAVVEEMLDIGQRSGFGAAFVVAAFSLCGLGEFEPAAVAMGFGRGRSDIGLSDLDRRLWDTKDAEIDAALGRDAAEVLRARGAAMVPDEIVAYLRDQASRILAKQP